MKNKRHHNAYSYEERKQKLEIDVATISLEYSDIKFAALFNDMLGFTGTQFPKK